jgi:hypothetical protein
MSSERPAIAIHKSSRPNLRFSAFDYARQVLERAKDVGSETGQFHIQLQGFTYNEAHAIGALLTTTCLIAHERDDDEQPQGTQFKSMMARVQSDKLPSKGLGKRPGFGQHQDSSKPLPFVLLPERTDHINQEWNESFKVYDLKIGSPETEKRAHTLPAYGMLRVLAYAHTNLFPTHPAPEPITRTDTENPGTFIPLLCQNRESAEMMLKILINPLLDAHGLHTNYGDIALTPYSDSAECDLEIRKDIYDKLALHEKSVQILPERKAR